MVTTYVCNKKLGVARAPSAYALFIKDVSIKGVQLPVRHRLRTKTGVRSGTAIRAKWSGPEVAEAAVINQSCVRTTWCESVGARKGGE